MQPSPSERENREFTKANTLQVQRRLQEVEAARMELQGPLFFNESQNAQAQARDSYTSLDGILSSYESSDESEDTAREKPSSSSSSPESSPSPPKPLALTWGTSRNRHAHLGPPPEFMLSQKQLEWPGAISKPPTPPLAGEWQGWDTETTVTASSSARLLDIETAFSCLGGFGTGGIWRKIAVLVTLNSSPPLSLIF